MGQAINKYASLFGISHYEAEETANKLVKLYGYFEALEYLKTMIAKKLMKNRKNMTSMI